MAVITAVLGVLVLVGVNEKVSGSIGVLIGAILAFPVRSGVTPVATAVTLVKEAAGQAAEAVASGIDPKTAGPVGMVSNAAIQIVQDATADATAVAMGALGVNKH